MIKKMSYDEFVSLNIKWNELDNKECKFLTTLNIDEYVSYFKNNQIYVIFSKDNNPIAVGSISQNKMFLFRTNTKGRVSYVKALKSFLSQFSGELHIDAKKDYEPAIKLLKYFNFKPIAIYNGKITFRLVK
jgi:hypothetical protein